MLRVENLSKTYPNGTRALKDVSFVIERGQFVAIIGLSGSGKSTLLRCINRLVEPTSGRVFLGDTEITAASGRELRQIRRRIGMVFQHFNLVKRSSVITNVLTGELGRISTLAGLLHNFAPSDYAEAKACLERVGLADRMSQRADTLSGGQQQRVGVARALMQNPELILADEPVASLDPASAHTVLDHLAVMNREGITILCNLHFLSLARKYSCRVLALKNGEIVFDGPPETIDDARFRQIYGEDAEEVEIA